MLSADDIVEILSTEIIGIVPEDETILSVFKPRTAGCVSMQKPASEAYRDIARRLIGENIPLKIPTGQRVFLVAPVREGLNHGISGKNFDLS